MTGQPTTEIRLCGRLSVCWEGERLEDALLAPQQRLLFAYLVLNRDRVVRRDELVEVIGAESSLAPALSRLRRALGPDRLEGRGQVALALPPDAVVDRSRADALVATARAALGGRDFAAARDAALAAVAIAERGLLPDLEADWLDAHRRALADVHVEALELRAAAGLAFGGPELAAAEPGGARGRGCRAVPRVGASDVDGAAGGARQRRGGAARVRGAAGLPARGARHGAGAPGQGPS